MKPKENQWLSPPGDTIIETIQALDISKASFAQNMGLSETKLDDLIAGRNPITKETALKLEKSLKIPASFWMNREKHYHRACEKGSPSW